MTAIDFQRLANSVKALCLFQSVCSAQAEVDCVQGNSSTPTLCWFVLLLIVSDVNAGVCVCCTGAQT